MTNYYRNMILIDLLVTKKLIGNVGHVAIAIVRRSGSRAVNFATSRESMGLVEFSERRVM